MVGCGGFGAAKAGAAIMVSAAAKEPAMVALAKAFLEVMAVILSREIGVSVASGGDAKVRAARERDPCYVWSRRLITVAAAHDAVIEANSC